MSGPADPLDYLSPSDTAERAVIGIILQDPGLIAVASDIVGPGDFESPRYAQIFETMLVLYGRGEPPDMVMLRQQDPAIDAVLLADLVTELAGPGYLDAYAREIARASRARKIQSIGVLVVQAAARGDLDAVRRLTVDLEAITSESDRRQRVAFDTISATQLATVALPDPRMLVDTLLPEGFSLLVGRAKIGKSFLALNLAIAVASGGKALGRCDVQPGDVLYLALEDTLGRLQQRMNVMLCGAPPPAGLDYVTESPRHNEGGIERIETWVNDHPDARLVIVDTLGRFKGNGNGRANGFDADYLAMSELKGITDRHPGLSLLVLHHQNKRLDHADPFDSVSGTGAIAAGPDTVLIFERKRGQMDGTLYFRGRDIGESDYGLSFDPVNLIWAITGTADEARMSREQREVLAAIEELGKDATPKEILDAMERVGESARVSTQNMLRKMVKSGVLVNSNGKYRRAIAYQGPHTTTNTITPITPITPITGVTPITPRDWERAPMTVIEGTAVTGVIGVIAHDEEGLDPWTRDVLLGGRP